MKGKVMLNKGEVHRNERDTVKANNTFKITNSVKKEIWSEFVYNHSKGNIFQTPEMYGVYERTKNYELIFLNAGELTSQLNIHSTFFVTAALAAEIEDDLQELTKSHQIGCHGLTHGDDENFAKLPYEEQLYRIEKATNILETFVSTVTAFRAPGVRISSTTLKILEDFGYIADSSISSQRFDLASSNTNPKILFAQRLLYHLDKNNIFKEDDMKIGEIRK